MTAIDFSSFVDQLATASGDTILPFFRTALAIENKKAGGFDPVTAADRAAEQSMRTLIRKQFPGHGILGEEYGYGEIRYVRAVLHARPTSDAG